MTRFFNPDIIGFSEKNADGFTIEITDEYHQSLLVGQLLGQRISTDENGYPVLIDIVISDNTIKQIVDEKITALMTVATETIAPLQDAVDLGIATDDETTSLTAWKNYRVLVNRVTTQSGYPKDIDWPVQPE